MNNLGSYKGKPDPQSGNFDDELYTKINSGKKALLKKGIKLAASKINEQPIFPGEDPMANQLGFGLLYLGDEGVDTFGQTFLGSNCYDCNNMTLVGPGIVGDYVSNALGGQWVQNFLDWIIASDLENYYFNAFYFELTDGDIELTGDESEYLIFSTGGSQATINGMPMGQYFGNEAETGWSMTLNDYIEVYSCSPPNEPCPITWTWCSSPNNKRYKVFSDMSLTIYPEDAEVGDVGIAIGGQSWGQMKAALNNVPEIAEAGGVDALNFQSTQDIADWMGEYWGTTFWGLANEGSMTCSVAGGGCGLGYCCCTIADEGIGGVELGCTDPEALNYNPNAVDSNLDDDSIFASPQGQNNMSIGGGIVGVGPYTEDGECEWFAPSCCLYDRYSCNFKGDGCELDPEGPFIGIASCIDGGPWWAGAVLPGSGQAGCYPLSCDGFQDLFPIAVENIIDFPTWEDYCWRCEADPVTAAQLIAEYPDLLPSCDCCTYFEDPDDPFEVPENTNPWNTIEGPIIGCTDENAINYNPNAEIQCGPDFSDSFPGANEEYNLHDCSQSWQGEGCGCQQGTNLYPDGPYPQQEFAPPGWTPTGFNCCCDYSSQPTEDNWQSLGPVCCDINAENYGHNAQGQQLNVNGIIDTYIMTLEFTWYSNPLCDWGSGGYNVYNPNNVDPQYWGVPAGSICYGDVSPPEEEEIITQVPMKEPEKDKEKEPEKKDISRRPTKQDVEPDNVEPEEEDEEIDNRINESLVRNRLKKLAGIIKKNKIK
jgi:hypothetical protein